MDQTMNGGRKRKHGPVDDQEESSFTDAPRDIKIVEFAESRAAEIEALTKCCETIGGVKRVFQTLPRHMRRRAMSHNNKRLPRGMRDVAVKESEKHENKKAVSKRPSRRHRRRPKNLLSEYNRRKQKHVWLETHIWHAKRFKMAEKWGYKIPLHPNDKSSRAAYRAADQHCLLQDMSYLCCVEVTGPQRDMLDGLSHLTSQNTGRTFAAKFSLDGSREGRTMLYACDQYPYNAIGCVDFLWKPEDQSNPGSDDSANQRQLWMWSHPACFSQIWDELCKAFCATKINPNPIVGTKPANAAVLNCIRSNSSSMEPGDNNEEFMLKPRSAGDNDVILTLAQTSLQHSKKASIIDISSSRHAEEKEDIVTKCLRASNGSVTLTSLKDSLVRYRLWGPLSQPVLADLCKMPSVSAADDSTNQWWVEQYKNVEDAKTHEKQWETWDAMKSSHSPAELSPHCVLALTVRDPRIFLPPKKTKVVDAVAGEIKSNIPHGSSLATSPKMASSSLWQQDVRDSVRSTKISEQEMNRKRSQLLIPGSQLELGDEESRVPVLLIQRPGKQKCITYPKKQKNAVWKKQTATDSLKKQAGCNPTKLLCTGSGNRAQFNRGNQSNIRLGFGSGWDIILPSGWGMAFWVSLVYRGARVGGSREAQSVAREQGDLHFPLDFPDTEACKTEQQSVRRSLENKHGRYPPAKRPNFVKLGTKAPFHCPWEKLVNEWDSNIQETNTMNDQTCSVMEQNVKAERESSYYVLRDKEDLKKLKAVLQTTGTVSDVMADDGSSAPTLLCKLRRALVAVRITMHKRGTPSQFAMICLPKPHDLESLQENTDYGGPMEPLHKDLSGEKMKSKKRKKWRKKDISSETFVSKNNKFPVDNLLSSTSREMIGFVNHGAFSLAQGFGSGLGFCSAIGLLRLAALSNQDSLQSLVRSANCLQYRFAQLSLAE